MELVDIFKALGDETRLRIINLLGQKDLCVCELQEILSIGQSSVSQHCNRLKTAGLIKSYKKAQWVIYSLNKDIIKKYAFLEAMICDLNKPRQMFEQDINKLPQIKGCD